VDGIRSGLFPIASSDICCIEIS